MTSRKFNKWSELGSIMHEILQNCVEFSENEEKHSHRIAELKKQVSDLTKVSSQLLLNIRELFWILIIYMILLFPMKADI